MIQVIKKGKWLIAAITILCLSNSSFAQSQTSSKAFEITNKDLKEFVGDYKTDDPNYFNITISMNGDDKLMAQPTDKSEPNTLMVTTKKDFFDLANTLIKIHSNRGENGRIVSLTFSAGGESFDAKRKGRS
jgi:hypothetical protein